MNGIEVHEVAKPPTRDLGLRYAAWLVLAALLAGPSWAAQPPRGYQSRACGFDLDGDGIHGEPADDCGICSDVSGNGPQLNDVDGDLAPEDEIYVDAALGSDVPTCGGPWDPCATIKYAIQTIADGPNTGNEDIICIAGTFTQEWEIFFPHGGQTGTHTRPASGSEDRDWLFPSDPLMIVGWDKDGDGEYPPHDPDDTAVLDGSGMTVYTKQVLFDRDDHSNLEFAHFTIRGYFDGMGEQIGDLHISEASYSNYTYWHDVRFVNVFRDACASHGRIMFTRGNETYTAWENVDFENVGGYLSRGFTSNASATGPSRWKNISYVCDPTTACGNSYAKGCLPFDVSGMVTGTEIIDSVWDANPEVGGSQDGSGVAIWAQIANCPQEWHVVNNLFKDWKTTVQIQGGDLSYCNPGRPNAHHLFEANEFYTDNTMYGFVNSNVTIFAISHNSVGTNRVEDVTIRNNYWYCSVFSDCGVFFDGKRWGHDGAVNLFTAGLHLLNNTLRVDEEVAGWKGVLLELPQPQFTHSPNEIHVKGNLVAGFNRSGQLIIKIDYSPLDFQADGNVYPPPFGANMVGGTTYGEWVDWQAQGHDANGKVCNGSFDTLEGVHLAASDTCARDAGIATGVTGDYDGDGRPQGAGWDIGADEYSAPIFSDDFESGDLSRWHVFQ